MWLCRSNEIRYAKILKVIHDKNTPEICKVIKLHVGIKGKKHAPLKMYTESYI